MSTGTLFLFSLVFLSLIVCSVYTLAVEVHVTPSQVMRSMLKRLMRLGGLLAGLALIVYFFSLV